MEDSNFTFYCLTNEDYNDRRDQLFDLFQRCETTNQSSATMNLQNRSAPVIFHCEFTDYLWCMKQYSKSYCFLLQDAKTQRVVGACVFNLKDVHIGGKVIKISFGRLARIDPERRRQYLILKLFTHVQKLLDSLHIDFTQGYTLFTNTPSLTLQRTYLHFNRKEICLLDIFVIATKSDDLNTTLRKLTAEEMEQLCMTILSDWVCRPVLDELQRIVNMTEYVGTFCTGDFPSGRYTVASVWQSFNAIVCDDRPSSISSYRGPYWLIFNFFQSPELVSSSDEEKLKMLSSLSNLAFRNGIPFVLCHIQKSSVFHGVCRKQALAMTTEILSWNIYSQQMFDLKDEFDQCPVWLDPRDFSSLLYFTPLSDCLPCKL